MMIIEYYILLLTKKYISVIDTKALLWWLKPFDVCVESIDRFWASFKAIYCGLWP